MTVPKQIFISTSRFQSALYVTIHTFFSAAVFFFEREKERESALCIKWQMDISIRNPCLGHFIRLSIKLRLSL